MIVLKNDIYERNNIFSVSRVFINLAIQAKVVRNRITGLKKGFKTFLKT